MKKTTKAKLVKKVVKTNHTGVALLLCFLLAAVAVAIALRQMELEKKYQQDALKVSSTTEITGEYLATTNVGKPSSKTFTLTLDSNRIAKLSSKMTGNNEPQTLSGTWSGDSNGTIITSFNDKIYAFSYLPEGTGAIRILNPDVEFWGAATLALSRKTNN